MIAGSDSLDPSRGHRALRITLVLLLLAAALAPLLHLVISLVANYYAVPYYDSWNFFYRLAKFLNGESSLGSYLFSQQNEARPAFPRLLLLLVHSVSRSLTIDVLLNVASAVGSAVVTLLLLRKTNPILRWPALLAVAIFFNLNFFSIAQWQNWNWRNQLILLLPNFFFALGWLVNLSRLPPLLRGLLVSLCCAASTFSFANGLFQWFLLVPLAFGLARKEKIRLWSLHAAAALLCIAVYFTGYERPEGHDPSAALAYPGRVVVYFSAWLGSSLSAGSQPVAEVWGVILFVTFLFLCWQCYVRWRAEGLQAGWLPWISMGCYALISGGVTALGRSHIGLEQALRPRYCSISQWLIVGILGLGATLLQQSWTRKPAQARATGGLLLLLAAGFLYFQARHTLQAGEEWHKFAERMHFQKQAFGLEAAQPGQLWSFDQSDRNAVLDTYK
ncbi:MAG: hypothetical protein M3429_03365, partial [Verrucomicrobiota bacterium]|nr:hypothetical protein [Verrucomicrobiota bacterium]